MINKERMSRIIKDERLALDETIEHFASKVGIARQTLSKWEKGFIDNLPLVVLMQMCELFKCDLGYIVGEYSFKTRQATDINAETGLSEEAIEVLRKKRPEVIAALNELLVFNDAEVLVSIAAYLNFYLRDYIYLSDNGQAITESASNRVGRILGDNQGNIPEGYTMEIDKNNLADIYLLQISSQLQELKRTYKSGVKG